MSLVKDKGQLNATQVEYDLIRAVNEECSCGGSGPNDPKACQACLVYHRFKALLQERLKSEVTQQPQTTVEMNKPKSPIAGQVLCTKAGCSPAYCPDCLHGRPHLSRGWVCTAGMPCASTHKRCVCLPWGEELKSVKPKRPIKKRR